MRNRSLRIALLALAAGALVAWHLVGAPEHAARADAPPGRYTAGSDGATEWVKDNRTGLVWKKLEEIGPFTWAAAKTQCVSPWRLPTVRELQSLVDETRTTGAAIDATYFPGATAGDVWSSTPDAQATTKAWNVSFDTGADYNADAGASGRVRCVR